MSAQEVSNIAPPPAEPPTTLKMVPAEASPPPDEAPAAPAKKRRGRPPKTKGPGGRTMPRKDSAYYKGRYGERHDKVVRTMLGHQKLTFAEYGALAGLRKIEVGNRIRDLVAMGLAEYDGFRKQDRNFSLTASLTALGRRKAKWLMDDPFPYGTTGKESPEPSAHAKKKSPKAKKEESPPAKKGKNTSAT